ncbi:MAG: hypothetical protein IJB32_06580 [Clostridia bacterium]|nr:hypothetical protein [Clostridia bacterium]
MTQITVSEKDYNESNLLYVQSVMSELFTHADCSVKESVAGGRASLTITCPEYYKDIIKAELSDKLAEIIAIKYKYDFFKNSIRTGGLSKIEKEILLTSLIAADLEDDKKYSFDRLKTYNDVAVDGIFNFRLQPLKNKWKDIVQYVPPGFMNTQLKEFVSYLIENKKKRVYVDDGRVYDSHYRRLKRSALLDGDGIKIIREVLLSNCGEVELSGSIPKDDEYYLKEFYNDKIIFSENSYS